MSQTLYAVMGEIEEDPSVLRGAELQGRMERFLETVNREHGDALAAPLSSTGGFPEFSGVLHTYGSAYEIARKLSEAFHPLSVRMAVACGEVTSGLNAEEPEDPDGPAFDLAGDLLYRARKEDRMLLVETGELSFDTLFNALMLLLHRTVQQWTQRQWEVVSLYRKLGRQADVAERLGVSQQSVSSTLSGARWKVVAEVEESIEKVLNQSLTAKGSGTSQTLSGVG